MAEKLRQKDVPVVERPDAASIRRHGNLGFRRRCDAVLFVTLPLGGTLEGLVPAEGDWTAGERRGIDTVTRAKMKQK